MTRILVFRTQCVNESSCSNCKNFLDALGITAATSAIDAGIQKEIQHDSGVPTLIISIEEMNDIMKIVKALEDSNPLLKGITKAIRNGTK